MLVLVPVAVQSACRVSAFRWRSSTPCRTGATGRRRDAVSAFLPLGVTVLAQAWHARRVEKLVDDLAHRSRTDRLTGAGNRWAFELDLAERLRGSRAANRRRTGDPTATTLVLVDVDDFKSYNDRHGHPAGDDALVQVARDVRSACRAADGIHRIGGDEFAVLLTGEHGEGLRVAERIRRTVAMGQAGHLTVSLGVATSRGEDAPALIDRADRALYRAKERGRDRVDSHHPGSAPDPAHAVAMSGGCVTRGTA